MFEENNLAEVLEEEESDDLDVPGLTEDEF
jgi:hypothetical protein